MQSNVSYTVLVIILLNETSNSCMLLILQPARRAWTCTAGRHIIVLFFGSVFLFYMSFVSELQ